MTSLSWATDSKMVRLDNINVQSTLWQWRIFTRNGHSLSNRTQPYVVAWWMNRKELWLATIHIIAINNIQSNMSTHYPWPLRDRESGKITKAPVVNFSVGDMLQFSNSLMFNSFWGDPSHIWRRYSIVKQCSDDCEKRENKGTEKNDLMPSFLI